MTGLIAVVFFSVAVAVLAIGAAIGHKASPAEVLRSRLESIDTVSRRHPSPDLQLLRDELLSGIPALNKLLAHWAGASRLQLLLQQADLKLRPGKFLLLCACCGGAGFSLVDWLIPSFKLALLGLAVGLAIPVAYVFHRRTQRFRKFEQLFPQAIELLVRSTRAGHPFTSALEMIGNELEEPVASEFRRINEEQKFGLPVREALLNLVDRVPLLDVKFMVTTLMLQRETGGNLAEILEKLAYVIRERFRILRQVRVYTAQGRLTMMILMALPPGILLIMSITSPEFLKPLFNDPIGQYLIVAGVLLQTAGFFLIRRIIEIKV
jgi:tight adherence protein B